MAPGAAGGGALPAGEGKVPSSSAQRWWGTLGVLGPVLGSPGHERCGHTGVGPVKGCEGEEGVEAFDERGEAEQAGTVQSGDEKAQRGLINAYKHLMWGVKEKEPNSSQWYPETG